MTETTNLACLAALITLACLSTLSGCSQSQSAATDRAVASEDASAQPTTDSASTGSLEPVSQVTEPAAEHASATAETPKPQRPPADRGPSRPGDAEKITFEDLNLGMQADVVFREFMAKPVEDLLGKRISIVGYMHPPETQRGIKKFILLKNTQCKFGPGGQADHLADVNLRADNSTVFTPSPLKVEGTLKLAPFQGPDGNTWSIYRLEDAQIR